MVSKAPLLPADRPHHPNADARQVSLAHTQSVVYPPKHFACGIDQRQMPKYVESPSRRLIRLTVMTAAIMSALLWLLNAPYLKRTSKADFAAYYRGVTLIRRGRLSELYTQPSAPECHFGNWQCWRCPAPSVDPILMLVNSRQTFGVIFLWFLTLGIGITDHVRESRGKSGDRERPPESSAKDHQADREIASASVPAS